MHHHAFDIADYIGFAVLAAGFAMFFAFGFHQKDRYKSVEDVPRRVFVTFAVVWFPLVFLVMLTQIYHHSTPWLMYVPFAWLYPT